MNDLKTRREFLRTTVLGGAVTWTVPAFLSRTFSALQSEAAEKTQPVTGKDGTILVVLQLAGGNDGLNTVIPATNDYYHKARPNLRVAANLYKLTDEFALHPGLMPFKELFDLGQLGIIQGVGYPNPNRSHFRSTEIWQTASDSDRAEKYGWLGRYFDNACKGADPTVGVTIGRQMPQAFAGPKPLGISLENPEQYRLGNPGESGDFIAKLNEPPMMQDAEANSGTSIGAVAGSVKSPLSALDYLERTALDARLSSDRIIKISRGATNQATYPASGLSNSLKLVARLIAGGLPTRVYYVSQGGYDTHSNQSGSHDRLLRDMGSSVRAFISDIQAQGNGDRVLLMTFSEFGRRLAQNANGGTDHGAAAPMFLIGSKVKGGIYGRAPSLAPQDLQNGDPKFTTDFRSVYAGVLSGWLKTDPDPVLGNKFEPLLCV
jgi:uncharacterized protein (DUF1501 family)